MSIDESMFPDSALDECDPITKEIDDDEDIDEVPYAVTIEEGESDKHHLPVDERTDAERTSDLLDTMSAQRRILLAILRYCQEAKLVGDVNEYVDNLQSTNRAVYTAVNYCSMLKESGALSLVNENGEIYAENDNEPQVVVVDGVEYLRAQDPATPYWCTTPVGRAQVQAEDEQDRVSEMLSTHEEYFPVFKKALIMCCQEGGCPISTLSDAIDDAELVQKPRRYTPFFMDLLDKCDAVSWTGSCWETTEVGKDILDRLSDIESL